MLIGQYEGTVSEKKQVAFPKKFRALLGNTIVITKGFDGNLVIVSEKGWETLLEGTARIPFTNKTARETQRYLLGNASVVELDNKGRFVLPEYLREYAGISKEIVFAGINRFVEVWDKRKWNEAQKVLADNIVSITEKLNGQEEK